MCRLYETYFAIKANSSIFANVSEAAVACLVQLGGALPTPPASPRDSGHPRCGAHGTCVSSLVPRADSPVSPPGYFWHRVSARAARSDFIRWCFKYSVLCVSCCVNVNVENFKHRLVLHQIHVLLAGLIPTACDIWLVCLKLSYAVWQPCCSYLTISRYFLPFSGAVQQAVCAVHPVSLHQCSRALSLGV